RTIWARTTVRDRTKRNSKFGGEPMGGAAGAATTVPAGIFGPRHGDCICGGKSEGRRGQDDHGGQPRGLCRRGGRSHSARGPGPPMQRNGGAGTVEGPRPEHLPVPAG